MALLTVSITRTQTADRKNGAVSIAVTATGNVLATYSENFSLDTADNYILGILLDRAKQLMKELAFKQIPMSFSFTVDSDNIRSRTLFDL